MSKKEPDKPTKQRSPAAKALELPQYRQKTIPNKKRLSKAPKVDLDDT